MSTIRYVPTHPASSVSIAARETDSMIVVNRDGYETSDTHVQRALDAHPSVKREPRATKPATAAPKQTTTPKGNDQ